MPLVRRRSHSAPAPRALSFAIVLALITLIPVLDAAAARTVEHTLRWSEQDFEIRRADDGDRVHVDGAYQWNREGRPVLPRLSRSFVVPRGLRASGVEVLDARWVDVTDVRLAAGRTPTTSQGERGSEDPFGRTGEVLARAGVEPATPVVVGASHPLRGWSIASLDVVPVRTTADGRVQRLESLRVRMQLEIDVRSNDTATRRVDWPGVAARDAALVSAVVDNPQDVARYAPDRGVDPSTARFDFEIAADEATGLGRVARIVPEPVDMLILTNGELRPEFERLAAYRTREGLRTAVVTISEIVAVARPGGDLQETLRNYVRTAFEQWGVSYLLLGGDADILPPRYARSSFYPSGGFTDVPADLYFAALDGNWNLDGDGIYAEPFQSFLETGDEADLQAEIAIGRAPVETLDQARTFVEKIFAYESPADPTYVGRALFMSEVLFPQAWEEGDSITLDGATYSESIIFDSIIGGGNLMQSWRMYENFNAYAFSIPETKQAALDSMSTGRFGLVNHVGHGFYYNMSVGLGDGNIFVPDVDTSVNNPPDRPFLLHALNCSSGAFDFDCLLERFVKVADRGAVGTIGASRAAFPSTANVYQQGFYREIFVNGNLRAGDAQLVSRTEQVGVTAVEGSHRWTHFGYHMFLDPALRVWREEPTVVNVAAPSSVTTGTSQISVGVTAGGTGVEGATVAVSRPDGGLSVGTTDATGSAFLSLEGLSDRTGTIEVVVTGANVLPAARAVTVQSSAMAHLRATPDAVFDSGSGDGDGQPEAGETIEWVFRIENDGGSDANSVNIQLQPVQAPGLLPITLSRSVASLPAGQTVVPQAFVFALDPDLADGSLLTFDLRMTAGATTWTQPVQFVAGAPEIDLARIRWDDSVTGDGDGVIDEGETVDLIVEVTNYGGAAVNALDVSLVSQTGNVTIVDGAASAVGPIGTREATTITGLRVTETNVASENPIRIELTDDEGRVFSKVFDLRAPGPPPAPFLDTTFGPDKIAIRTEGITQPFVRGHRVYRRAGDSGPFAEVTFDTIERTGFIMDDGLDALTRYDYRITYVDSTGVESDPSPVVAASTAPPEQAGGFPLPVTRELAGAIAVGNMIPGGPLVATFGADYLYAIDATGNELVNGDQDSQTRGPLAGTEDAQRFTPSGVAMADFDGDGVDELVGSNWDNYEVWVVKSDGTLLPGWPQPMNQRAWATPTVADLDGDGDLEVIVNNTNRTTYVWHHDGTDFFDGDGDPATVGIFQRRANENFSRSSVAVYDVDGDGTLEVIVPSSRRNGDDNLVHALRNDATNAPGWPQNVGPNGWTVSHPTIADVDGDGTVEIFLVTEDDKLHAWHPDGSNVTGYPKPLTTVAGARDSKHPAVAFGDFDSDGQLELVTVAILGAADCDVYIQELDGTVWPNWPVRLPGLSESSPLVGDVNGDGSLDIVFGIGGGTDNTPNQLYALNADGTDVAGFPITLPGAVRSVPVITDFNGDGDVDVVYAGFDLFLHVWDMPFAYDPALVPWGTFQGDNRRTGVFGNAVATSAPNASISARPTVEGVVLEARFLGGFPTDLELVVERREVGTGSYERVADGLRLDGVVLRWVDRTARPGARYDYRVAAADGSFAFVSEAVTVPTRRLALKSAVPNPFNPKTSIVFEVPGIAGGQVPTVLEVFDVTGRRVRSLLAEPLVPGEHRIEWNGTDDQGRAVASGTYFARLRAAGQAKSLKLTLVK